MTPFSAYPKVSHHQTTSRRLSERPLSLSKAIRHLVMGALGGLTILASGVTIEHAVVAAPVFNGQTRLFEISQEGLFLTTAPAVERTESATQFYDFYSASSHTGFEVARRSLIFLYRDIRTDDLALFLTHGIDDLGQPANEQQPSAKVDANIYNVPQGARIAEADDGAHEFGWGSNDNETRGNFTGNGPPLALGRWSFGSNTDGGAIDLLPPDQDWEMQVEVSLIKGIDEWSYFFADGTQQTLDPNLPLLLKSKGGSQEPDQVVSVEGQPVTVCALASDPQFNSLTYTFDWRDGQESEVTLQQGELACAEHTFGDDGNYNILITARNDNNESVSKIFNAIISNVIPSVIPGGPYIVEEQIPVTLEIDLITDPGFSDTHTARWDFDGDGQWDTDFQEGLTYQAIYPTIGRFFARVEVRDDDGGVGAGVITVYVGVPPDAFAEETDPNIIIAGYSSTDPSVPFPVYRGAPITLKAMLRNVKTCDRYQVIWDLDEDGEFEENGDDAVLNNLSPTNSSIYDVGYPYEVPIDAAEGRRLISIRATNLCNGFIDYDVMRLYVYPWTPSQKPKDWTKDQLEVMTQVGLHEGLWYIHRKQANRGGGGAQISSRLEAGGTKQADAATALAVWAYTINGRLPAYPPNTLDPIGTTIPDGWADQNLIRWRLDPYAETVMRMLNHVVATSAGVANINASDEDNTCALDGTQCPRLPSSRAGQGVYVNGGNNYTYRHGLTTGALSTILPSLSNTPIQVGPLRGQIWNGFVQDMVDYLGYLQISSGCGMGGYYYHHTTSTGCSVMDASTAQWGYIGLESAEVAGFKYGVFVNNAHKYKTAHSIIRNQSNGAAAYRTDGGWANNNLSLTGGHFVIARWLGFQNYNSGDGTVPFPHTGYNKGSMADMLSRARTFTSNSWNSTNYGDYHVNRRFWNNGSYLCGRDSGIYKWGNDATCGNLYGIYSHQKGYRTTFKVYDRQTGEIQEGPVEPMIGGQDWERQFATYVLRSQERNLSNYSEFGRIDDCGGGGTITCDYGAYNLGVTMGTLTLTPTIFKPRPVADGDASPPEILAGCAGPDAGWVAFSHQGSFHPNPKSRIVKYQWDVDQSDGLWWDNGAPIDYEVDRIYFNEDNEPLDGAKKTFRHNFVREGNYTVTLRVLDDENQAHLKTFEIRVLGMQDADPTANHRGPYWIEVGEDLALKGVVNDLNLNCGDALDVRWSLSGAGAPIPNTVRQAINALRDATVNVPANALDGLQLQHAYELTLSVTDSTGRSSSASTDLIIYPDQPIADLQVSPQLARCGQVVRFDGSGSAHPHPLREVVSYAWDLDGQPGFERQGEVSVVEQSYAHFGVYPIRMKAFDDRGRSDLVEGITVTVNQGNQPPLAKLPESDYIILTQDPLTLNAGASFDPDVHCGDSIVAYRWFVNNADPQAQPQFTTQGPILDLAWAQLEGLLIGPADPRTGLPKNIITLEVEDSLGLTHRTEATVTLYQREPIAHFDQLPSPAPIDEETGEVTVQLDGRESFSPRPDGRVINYKWDVNGDGIFDEFIGQSVLTLRRIFEPVPAPDQIPNPTVSLMVIDDRGEEGTYQLTLSYKVGEVEPTADADPSDAPEQGYHILQGDSLFLNGAQTIEPNTGDWVRFYRWWVNRTPNGNDWHIEVEDIDGDRQESLYEVTSDQLAVFGVQDVGVYDLHFEAEDTTFLTDRDVSALTVHSASPIARINISRSEVSCGEQVTLDGSGSSHAHPDIDVVEWAWDLNDDGEFNGPLDRVGIQVLFDAQQFTFDQPQVVRLRVTDSRGRTSIEEIQMAVNQGNTAPIPNTGGPYSMAVSDISLRLDASLSADGEAHCGDAIVRYEWDFNVDGQYGTSPLEQRVSGQSTPTLTQQDLNGIFDPTNPLGTYEIGLYVEDRWGASQTQRSVINVYRGPQAVADVEPPRAACDTDVRFSGLASNTDGPLDQGFRIVSYEWDFDQDDEVDSTDPITIFRVGLGGADVQATLTITDESGRTDSTIATFEISQENNVAPVADAGGPYATGPINALQWMGLALDARASFDPDEPCDQIHIYKWDTDNDNLYGDDDHNGAGNRQGSDYTGDLVQNFSDPTWEVGLSKLVRVIVCDGRGACSAPSVQEVDVRASPPPYGEIISPRADDCQSVADILPINLRYGDLDGGTVRVKVFIDDVEVHRENLIADPDGAPRIQLINVDIEGLPDGVHALRVEVGDLLGAKTGLSPGGLLTFDRSAPTISFNDALLEGVCYSPEQVPDPTPSVRDTFDTTPTMEVNFIENACQRIVEVTSQDSCGNTSVATRSYRTSGPITLTIDGPEEGALVSTEDARLSWTYPGPPECLGQLQATLSSEGGPERVYIAGTQIEDTGSALLSITAKDCTNTPYRTQRSFTVNASPIARPIPPGHPNAVPLTLLPTYQITEGAPLLLEGRASAPPEDTDEIISYLWDLDDDGVFEREGLAGDSSMAADTSEDGVFRARLKVTDSFGQTHVQPFELIVDDVDPISQPSGPYQGLQGQEVNVDGRQSRENNSDDPLTRLVWEWGDGETTEGTYAEVGATSHIYDFDGLYEIKLHVYDEDSDTTQATQVNVGDVRPELVAVQFPQDPYALKDLSFEVEALAGAPEDRIISYDWDFLGDGNFESFPNPISVYRYLEPGEYEVTLRIVDPDSFTEYTQVITVRPVTLSDLLREIDSWVSLTLEDPETNINIQSVLAPAGQPSTSTWVTRGLWAETRRGEAIDHLLSPAVIEPIGGDADELPEQPADWRTLPAAPDLDTRMSSLYRGNTLLALDELLYRLNRAQVNGARFGAMLWKLSREILRETEAFYTAEFNRSLGLFNEGVIEFGPDQDARLVAAQIQLDHAREMFENVDFFDRVIAQDGYLARDLLSSLLEANFLIRDHSDLSFISGEFELTQEGDATFRVAQGNIVNEDLKLTVEQLYEELSTYDVNATPTEAGVEPAREEGPGLEAVRQALGSLIPIREWVLQPIGLRCLSNDPDDPDCQFIDDADSLSLQLALMDLVGDLFAAADAGVYVRNAQQMLTLAVKFRVEVALLRVEELCGINNPYPLSARAQQGVLLNLLEEDQRDAALLYYIAPERRCLVYEQYNECVIPALNLRNPDAEPRQPAPYPELCEGVERLDGAEFGEGQISLDPPIPMRPAFDDLGLLYDLINAYISRQNLAIPAVRAQVLPDREWDELNRDFRDDAFTLSDIDIALLQFNHDSVDIDQDGLLGLYEIDCLTRYNVNLSPTNPRTLNRADAEVDCDGDGIPNDDEISLSLNPVEHRDAELDTDGDGVTNEREWHWTQQGLSLDLRDPTDVQGDHDEDGIATGLEINAGLNPMNAGDATADFDQDGLNNRVELNNGLDPTDATDADADQDGDGLTAREEINRGRNPLVADCETDLVELSGRDDDPARARVIEDQQEGRICSALGSEDEDWYRVTIDRENLRFSARLIGETPGLQLTLYQATDGAQVASSTLPYAQQLLALSRGQLGLGEYWLKVSHRLGDIAPESPYRLDFTLIDPSTPCLPDAWEGIEGNNQRSFSHLIGVEELRAGDLWVCEDERNVGDWYEIELDGQDKTIHVGFSPNSDGQLDLVAMDIGPTKYAESSSLQKSAQCININANGQPGTLYFRVSASTIYADGDQRVDYTLQVLNTDLTQNPRGECDTLNNGLFDFFEWPTLDF